MSKIAVSVEGLGKCYRIGAGQRVPAGWHQALRQKLLSPVSYLQSRLRGPSEDETFWALRDVSFEVSEGGVLGVIGRNGAGKSTLLRILSRITDPSVGRAVVRGRLNALLEVGTGFHPELTGRENIFMNAAIHGMRRADVRRSFDEIVEFAEISRFIDTPVKRYSSGMYMRLAFAVAAHLEPDILVVDEVLAVGDFEFQKKCLGKMQDVAGSGRTVLFVSHNMEAVSRLCHSALLLTRGRVARLGPTTEVLEEYLRLSGTELGERRWDDPAAAPGNQVARLRAIRACDETGHVCNQFKVTEPFLVQVEFDALSSSHALTVVLQFFGENGAMLLQSLDSASPGWPSAARGAGRHVATCLIPAHLLNDGLVHILVGVVTHPWDLHALEREALTVRMMDDYESVGARGTFTREWPRSAVRPLLTWRFDRS